MKQIQNKKWIAVLVVAGMTLGLSGCFGNKNPMPAPSASPAPANAEQVRTGMGVVTQCKGGMEKGGITVTAAGVLLDEQGRILRCVVDEAECELTERDVGVLGMPDMFRTKYERGMEYGLKKASAIGKEWYEQIDAFCNAVKGKKPEEVKKIVKKDGHAVDNVAGCTIRVEPYVNAIEKACENAQHLGAKATDSIRLGTALHVGGRKTTFEKPGVAQITASFALLSKDKDGYVTSAVLDEVEPVLEVKENKEMVVPSETVKTKLEQGDSYGMKNASKIGREWHEQSAGLAQYLKGKNAGQIQGIPANGSDPDLAAVCTISINDLMAAVSKAAE